VTSPHAHRPFRAGAWIVCIVGLCAPALANHGPGASGGGSSTISGETLKPGHWELSLREDFSQFQHFTRAEAAAVAARHDDFDALDHGFITSLDFAYGVVEDLQIGASTGYFIGRNFISAERQEDGSVETSTAEPTGLTDLTVTAKYRLLKGKPGNLAIIAGVKLPTGRRDVHLANGEGLSPTDEPSTGAWDFLIGVGYSRFITSHLTIDASAAYTFRTQHDNFTVGDRIDLGAALAYRITDSVQTFPQFSVFGELIDVCLMKDTDHDEYDENSGSNTLYFSPGLRVRFSKDWALTAAPAFPIVQDLNGDQGKVRFKMAITVSYSY
jgi:hypothetical protein